jgi:hypothetical protein
VFGSPDIDRAGTRRILACPYCHGLQAIPPQPVRFTIGCRECHRLIRITEAGAPLASDRTDEALIAPRCRPSRVFIDRRVEPADEGNKQAPERATSTRWMGMLRETLRGVRSTVITLLALAAAAVAVYVLLTVLDSTHTAVRRALPEGSMLTVGHDVGESESPSGGRPERLGMPSCEVWLFNIKKVFAN